MEGPTQDKGQADAAPSPHLKLARLAPPGVCDGATADHASFST